MNNNTATTPTAADVHAFTEGYAEALIWSDCDDVVSAFHAEGLDAFSADDAERIRTECAEWLAAHFADVRAAMVPGAARYASEPYDLSHAGHDFALTRNGHGAGFWDRGLGEVGERLSAAARAAGEVYVYQTDVTQLGLM